MLFFVDKISRLQDKQVTNTIVDIIQAFQTRKDNVKYSVTLFGLILDILCSEGIVSMDPMEKLSICYETLQRLPAKMYMQTDSVEISGLLNAIVRDVVLGDMFHENSDMQQVLGPGNKSVTFSRHIDMGEFSRQMCRLEHILISRQIVDSECAHSIVRQTTQSVFVQLQRMRNNNGNNRDIKKIIGGSIAVVVRDYIIDSLALQVCLIDGNNSTTYDYCMLWMGVSDFYSRQYTLSKTVESPNTPTDLVQKMVCARQQIKLHAKTHGLLATKEMVKQILTVVIKILPVTADFVKIQEFSPCIRHVKMVLFRADVVDMHSIIHTQAHINRGIHLLQDTEIARPTKPLVKEAGMVIPQSIFEAVSNMPMLLQLPTAPQQGRAIIHTWLRKQIIISFLHILWSVYGGN